VNNEELTFHFSLFTIHSLIIRLFITPEQISLCSQADRQQVRFGAEHLCCACLSFKEETKAVRTELHIEGMRGDPCATTIKETLEGTAGVHEADVTFKRKTAIVDFDEETVQQATLVKKIQDLGYTATVSGQPQSEVGA
jgi:mercuric ion binding protein